MCSHMSLRCGSGYPLLNCDLLSVCTVRLCMFVCVVYMATDLNVFTDCKTTVTSQKCRSERDCLQDHRDLAKLSEMKRLRFLAAEVCAVKCTCLVSVNACASVLICLCICTTLLTVYIMFTCGSTTACVCVCDCVYI
jgi:hypothetical protein